MRQYNQNELLPNESLSQEGIVIWKGPVYHDEPLHTHDFIEIVYIYSGEGIHLIDNIAYPVSCGDMLFINYGQTHSFKSTSDDLIYCNILLLPQFINTKLINSENAADMLMLSTFKEFSTDIKKTQPYIPFKNKELYMIEFLIDEMIFEYSHKLSGYHSALVSLMTTLLIKIFRKIQDSDTIETFKKTNQLTPEILNYIEKHCFEKITMADLAKKCFYNPSYFSRVFKECFGKTLTDYIQEVRIEKAKELLKNSDMSVNRIASYVGYNDKTQFYRVFKKYSDDISPNLYRKKFKQE